MIARSSVVSHARSSGTDGPPPRPFADKVRARLQNRSGFGSPRPQSFPRGATRGFAVVALGEVGDRGRGKPDYHKANFFRFLRPILAEYGIAFAHFRSVQELLSTREVPDELAVLPLYNEVDCHANQATYEPVLRALEDFVRHKTAKPPLHGFDLACMLANKVTTNALFAELDVPTPAMVAADSFNGGRIFANAMAESAADARILDSQERLDARQYNTQFIDTTQVWQGREYYVCPRAVCAGRRCVAILVRAAPKDLGNASVHVRNTPRDPSLLNHLYALLLQDLDAIAHLCDAVGRRLGPGLYAHDLLPEQESGRIFICETGFKVQNDSFARRMAPISGELCFSDDMSPLVNKTKSHALIMSLIESGYFST